MPESMSAGTAKAGSAMPMEARNGTLVINLWHLKSTNGMFYYACDYLREIQAPALILLNSRLQGFEASVFGGVPLRRLGLFGYLRFALSLLRSGGSVFTPTPHPLPFVSRQLVVVHDPYPFEGTLGFFKMGLLRLSLMTSGCRVGYINNSGARRFVDRCVASENRKVFLPNHFPPPSRITPRQATARMVVGLIGTDSAKKDYAALFDVVCSRDLGDRFEFLIFGHDSPYFRSVRAKFSELRIRLMPSDTNSIDAFLVEVDCVTSVARNEGFGRPIAHALAGGIPCFLLDDEVFREFYGAAAVFSHSIEALVENLLRARTYEDPKRQWQPSVEISAAIERGIALIDSL